MQIDQMAERLVAMTCTDHQGADAQCRSCPLVVSALPQGEHHSARSRAHVWRAQQWWQGPLLPPYQLDIPCRLLDCERAKDGLRGSSKCTNFSK